MKCRCGAEMHVVYSFVRDIYDRYDPVLIALEAVALPLKYYYTYYRCKECGKECGIIERVITQESEDGMQKGK